MALYQPINVTPDLIGGIENGVIFYEDGTPSIPISWDVQGNSPMTAYQIEVLKNDTSSTQTDTTGKITFDIPYNNVNADGTPNRFTSYRLSRSALASAGDQVQNVWNEVTFTGKLRITMWWSATESVVQRSFSTFKMALSRSTLSITRLYDMTFQGTFSNSSYGETPQIEWSRFQLYTVQVTGAGPNDYTLLEPVQDTGKVWGCSNLKWDAGYAPIGYYACVLTVHTTFGETITAQSEYVQSNYIQALSYGPDVLCDRATNAVKIGLANKQTLNVDYTWSPVHLAGDDGVIVPAGETASCYDLYNLYTGTKSDKWGFVWVGTYPSGGGKLFSIVGSNGEDITATWDEANSQVRIKIASTGTGVWGSVAADKNLIELSYSGTTWTMILGRWSNGAYTYATGTPPAFTLGDPASVTFYGGTTVYDFAISWCGTDGTSASGFPNYATTGTPEYPYDPFFHYVTSVGLGFYALNRFGQANYGVLWRTDVQNSRNSSLLTIPAGDALTVYDFSAVNRQQYSYFVSTDFKYDNAYISTYGSKPVSATPCWWDWALVEAEKVTGVDGTTYHVTQSFLFGCNLTSGENANGNTPNVLSTFTRYPAVLRDTQNRQSGTLTALLGRITGPGEYTDSNSLRDAVRALSVSSKSLFLRNRRGDFMKIALSGPITTNTQDNSVKQVLSVSVPWVEIAPVDAPVILIVPGTA
jgi:hypothetical protein